MELDKFRDVDLVIDHVNRNFVEKQFVSQNDNDGRTLTILITNDGVVGEIPGVYANLRWTNQSSGLTDLSAFDLIDKKTSKFQIKYPKNMMNPGKVVASIQIIQNGQVAHSKQFEILVQQLAGEAKGIIQKAEYSVLVKTLSDANKFRTDIHTLDMSTRKKDEKLKWSDLDTSSEASKLKLENLSNEVKTAMTGSGTPVMIDPKPDTVTRETISGSAVDSSKTNFVKSSTNIFKYGTETQGAYMQPTGSVHSDMNYYLTEQYELLPGETIRVRTRDAKKIHLRKIAVKSSDGFVENLGYDQSPSETSIKDSFVNNTANKVWVYLSIAKLGNWGCAATDLMVYVSETEHEYVDYELFMPELNVERKNVKDKAISAEKTDFILQDNLLNPQKSESGWIMHPNGQLQENSGYWLTEMIKVNKGVIRTVTRDGRKIHLRLIVAFDKEGNVLTDLGQSNPIDVSDPLITEYVIDDARISHLRISIRTKEGSVTKEEFRGIDAQDLMIYLSDIEQEFSEYGLSIPDLKLSAKQKEEFNLETLKGKKILVCGTSISYGHSLGISYADLIAEKNRMSLFKKAQNGAKFKNILAQLKNFTDQPDIVVFDGGANDNIVQVENLPAGILSDGYDSTLDEDTIYGVVESIFKTIQTKFTGVPAIFVFVHKMPTRPQATQLKVNEIIKECADKWGISRVDLFNDSTFNTNLAHIRQKYTYDTATDLENGNGTHPNPLGYETFYIKPIVEMIKILI